MPKCDLDKIGSNDTHSVNISVYKPEGISSFWNWFTRKSNAGVISNPVFGKLKLNANDLHTLKLNGIDIKKLQNAHMCSNKITKGPKNAAVNQKNDVKTNKNEFLENFFILNPTKNENAVKNTRKYAKRFKSASSISVESNKSFVYSNVKYVHKEKSHKPTVKNITNSKVNLKVGIKSNTKINVQSNAMKKSVLLKSVPTAILKSNTEKKIFIPVYLGKKQIDKSNVLMKKLLNSENFLNTHCEKDNSNVIPMLLTKIKSMEEQISDIEHRTKKIKVSISQQNVSKPPTTTNNFKPENSSKIFTKNIATHKVYSKNLPQSRKSKPLSPRKLKSRSKYTFSSGSDIKETNHKEGTSNNNNNNEAMVNTVKKIFDNPEMFVKHHSFVIPKDISTKNLFHANPNIGCDVILKLLKSLTEGKNPAVINLNIDKENQNNLSKENGETNKDRQETQSLMSKPTFDWKHKSVSSVGESLMREINIDNEDSSLKAHKGISVPSENQILINDATELNKVLHRNNSSHLKQDITCQMIKDEVPLCTIANIETDIDPTDITPKDSVEKVENTEPISNKECDSPAETPFLVNFDCVNRFEESKVLSNQTVIDTNLITNELKEYIHCGALREKEKKGECHSQGNLLCQSNMDLKCDIFMDEEKDIACMQPMNHLPEIEIDLRKECSISVKESEMSCVNNHKGRSFRRTPISYENKKKEPRVSITIIVNDSLKDDVKMRSNIFESSDNSTQPRKLDGVYSEERGAFANIALSHEDNSNNINIATNASRETDQIINRSFYSLENIQTINYEQTNKTVEVQSPAEKDSLSTIEHNLRTEKYIVQETKKIERDYLLIGSRDKYLNQEKRKAFEKKKICLKDTKNIVQSVTKMKPVPKYFSDLTINLQPEKYANEPFLVEQETNNYTEKCEMNKKPQFISEHCERQFNNCRPITCHTKHIEEHRDENDLQITEVYHSSKILEHSGQHEVDIDKGKNKCEVAKSFLCESNSFSNSDNTTGCKYLDFRKRSNRCGLTLLQDTIIEESEEECLKRSENVCESQTEKGDNVEVQGNLCEPNIMLHNDYEPPSNKMKGDTLKVKEDNNTTENDSSCNKPSKSSVLVQTEWSLVGGVAIGNFLSTLKSKLSESNKRSVSTQTDVTVEQEALLGTSFTKYYESYSRRVSPFDFTVCNSPFMRSACERHDFQMVNDGDVKISDDLVKEGGGENVAEIVSNSLPKSVPKVNFNTLHKTDSDSRNNLSMFYKDVINFEKNQLQCYDNELGSKEELTHYCSVPCLTSPSKGSVLTDLSSAPRSKESDLSDRTDSSYEGLEKIKHKPKKRSTLSHKYYNFDISAVSSNSDIEGGMRHGQNENHRNERQFLHTFDIRDLLSDESQFNHSKQELIMAIKNDTENKTKLLSNDNFLELDIQKYIALQESLRMERNEMNDVSKSLAKTSIRQLNETEIIESNIIQGGKETIQLLNNKENYFFTNIL